jgi:hypothetical protein
MGTDPVQKVPNAATVFLFFIDGDDCYIIPERLKTWRTERVTI